MLHQKSAPEKARTFVKKYETSGRPVAAPRSTARPPAARSALARAIRAAAWLAPGTVERLAAALFARPRRTAPVLPVVAGLAEHRFRLRVPGDVVTVTEWGAGPTVLLAHGWNGHTGQMTSFVKPLVDAGYHVVAFDMPGHGGAAARHVHILDMRDAVVAVAQRMQTVHAIVAHSLGATATALAVAGGLPVERVVLVAPPAEVPHFVRRFAGFIGLPEERIPGLLALVRAQLGGSFEALDLRRLAPRLRARALVIHDPDDREVPFAHGAAIAAAWPGARLETAPGRGHSGVLRDERVVSAATDFVAGQSFSPASLISIMRRS